MTDVRADREIETRGNAERERSWQPPTMLPTPDPRDGYGFRWIRKQTLGEDDLSNWSRKIREGWEPVNPQDVPEISAAFTQDKRGRMIEVGGLVLCRMPVEMIRQRDAYYQRMNNLAVESVEETYLRDGGNDDRMKKSVERRSEVKSYGDRD